MELIFSLFLLIGSIYLFFLVGVESPAATATELGAAFWPRIILALLMILVVVNIINILKKAKADGVSAKPQVNLGEFFKSKLFLGIIVVVALAVLLPYIGFVPSCCLFLIAYGFLLGERKIPILIIRSVIITIIIYVIFQGALDIMLARGIGPFREFALSLEMILPF